MLKELVKKWDNSINYREMLMCQTLLYQSSEIKMIRNSVRENYAAYVKRTEAFLTDLTDRVICGEVTITENDFLISRVQVSSVLLFYNIQLKLVNALHKCFGWYLSFVLTCNTHILEKTIVKTILG